MKVTGRDLTGWNGQAPWVRETAIQDAEPASRGTGTRNGDSAGPAQSRRTRPGAYRWGFHRALRKLPCRGSVQVPESASAPLLVTIFQATDRVPQGWKSPLGSVVWVGSVTQCPDHDNSWACGLEGLEGLLSAENAASGKPTRGNGPPRGAG